MLTITVRNPDDGILTYTKIEIERSASRGGSFSPLTTVDIDTSTQTDGQSGFTSLVDSTGTSSYWYRMRYANPTTLVYSDYSEEWQGGATELDAQIRRRMKDSNTNKKFFTDNEIADARDVAIKSLYPHTWIDTFYDILITDLNKALIQLPAWITRMDDILIYDSDGKYCGKYSDYYVVGNNIFPNVEFPTGYTFRMIVSKRYTDAAEIPEHYIKFLLDSAELELLHVLEQDRARYYKYTTSIRPEGGNMPSLTRIVERLTVSLKDQLTSIRRVRTPTDMGLTQ